MILLMSSMGLMAEDIREFDLDTLQRLGNAMYEQDIRAARATDILQEANAALDPATMRGWIVLEKDASTTVRFFGEADGTYVARYDIVFSGKNDGVLESVNETPLSDAETTLANARLTVSDDLSKVDALCSSSYNVITLPDPDGDGYLVWAIAANLDPSAVQVGGHYRYTISADGKTIERRDRLFKSCLVLSLKPDGLPEGASLAALAMGWIVSDTPLEIHVFLQRYVKLPFMISTPNNLLWKVDEGVISKMD